MAIGGWRLVEIAGRRLAVGGWRRLVAVDSSWQLVMGGWWRLAAVDGWRLVAVGGWWWLAVGSWWRLAVGGSWRLAVGGPLGRSLRAVLNKKKSGPLWTALLAIKAECVWGGGGGGQPSVPLQGGGRGVVISEGPIRLPKLATKLRENLRKLRYKNCGAATKPPKVSRSNNSAQVPLNPVQNGQTIRNG